MVPAAESTPGGQSAKPLTVVRAAIKTLLAPVRSTNSAHKPRALRQVRRKDGFPPRQPPPIGVPCLTKRRVYHGLAAESFSHCRAIGPLCGVLVRARRGLRIADVADRQGGPDGQPSVVSIRGEKTVAPTAVQAAATEAPRRVNGMGTGIVIDPRGYILTNYHVVDGVREIQVTTADKKNYVATIVARDARPTWR